MANYREIPAILLPWYYMPIGSLAMVEFVSAQQVKLLKSLIVPEKSLQSKLKRDDFKGTFGVFIYGDGGGSWEGIMRGVKDTFGGFGMECRITMCNPKKNKGNEFIAMVMGVKRIRFVSILKAAPYYSVKIEEAEEKQYGEDVKVMRQAIMEVFDRALKANIIDGTLINRCEDINNPYFFSDVLVSVLAERGQLGAEELARLFREEDLGKKLMALHEKLLKYVVTAQASSEVREMVNEKVKGEMEENNHRIHLNMKKKAVEKELEKIEKGKKNEEPEETEQQILFKRIKEAKMPPETEKLAKNELRRLAHIGGHPLETQIIRDCLDRLCSYPWSVTTEDNSDLKNAQLILDNDHYGLEKIKRRLVEFLAIRKLNPKKKGGILCFVGPPGTGKTSLGKSIARALGRKYIRVSLGGVRDEAEIRGHKRTYVGALPGRIVRGITQSGSSNPVFILDEVDKMQSDQRGDPASALLEVLDPEQNHAFSDHYFGVGAEIDLSQVIFITTANYLEGIPLTLRDRLEIIELAGYTMREKLEIAKRHLLPKQIEENGLAKYGINFPDETILRVINSYAREAGVRMLERVIAGVLRNRAVKISDNKPFEPLIEEEELYSILGPEEFEEDEKLTADQPGIITGLAVTPYGGCAVFIEALKMRKARKNPDLIITGKLGEVAKESTRVSLTCALDYLKKMGQPVSIEDLDIHLHCEDNERGMEGPSAGGAITLAFISLFTGKKIKSDFAMTGEIDLLGRILPVGGIKAKVLAAHRAGYKHIFIPERNRKDLPEIPEEVRKDLNIMLANGIDEVAKFALNQN